MPSPLWGLAWGDDGVCIGNNTFVFEINVIPSWVIGLVGAASNQNQNLSIFIFKKIKIKLKI
jgi:hypothetical protein